MQKLSAFRSTHSLWYAARHDETGSSPLDRSVVADTCVIGAGIAGLASAYQLVKEGRDVVVLESGEIAGGETGRSTAHLSCVLDDRFQKIESLHGEAAARICYESHAAAIDWYGNTVAREEIDCELERVDGYLFLPPGEDEELIRREFEAARRAGARASRILARAPLDHFDTGPAIYFPQQAQCDPLALARGLAAACRRMGVRIFCGTHVGSIDKDRVVHCTGGFTVAANHLIVATNSPINNLVALHTKQHAYRTYAIALPVTRGSMPLALFWDTSQEPGDVGGAYHYARLQRRHPSPDVDDNEVEVLIVGGEDHKTGQANDADRRYGRLAAWANERFAVAGPVRARWSGQVMETVDGIAFLGRNPVGPENVYVITGDSGMGMTHGAIGAMIIADLIAGRSNPWADLYDPSRKAITAIGQYARENVNSAAQYTDWLSYGDVESPGEIAAGHGAIVRHGLKLIACYRDPTGRLFECSAVCPHLGGIVHWNSAEASWDCPCHGSRFDTTGKVCNGPATGDLTPTHEFDTAHASR